MDAYLGLFGSAFLAATVVPFSSEVLLLGLAAAGHPVVWLWLSATAGNTVGAALNWVLGRFALHYQHRRWFPIGPDQLLRARRWFQRFGVWALLLAWMPLGGDAITLVAGVMRVRFVVFLMLTAVGKGARYGIVTWSSDQLDLL